MAKTYQVTGATRFVNSMMKFMVRLGIAPSHTYILTVPGRKSGKLYSMPVSLVEDETGRYLVSPYGQVNWVKNARAASKVNLSDRSTEAAFSLQELPPEQAAPQIKKYLAQESFVLPYFDLTPESPLEEFVKIAPNHPVFRLVEV